MSSTCHPSSLSDINTFFFRSIFSTHTRLIKGVNLYMDTGAYVDYNASIILTIVHPL